MERHRYRNMRWRGNYLRWKGRTLARVGNDAWGWWWEIFYQPTLGLDPAHSRGCPIANSSSKTATEAKRDCSYFVRLGLKFGGIRRRIAYL
jgi:hypothetical protein